MTTCCVQCHADVATWTLRAAFAGRLVGGSCIATQRDRLYVIGRGAGLSIAGEMALKFRRCAAFQAGVLLG